MQEALNQKIDAFVAANKEQILKDIATLVSINSVEGTPEEGAPYGAGPYSVTVLRSVRTSAASSLARSVSNAGFMTMRDFRLTSSWRGSVTT